MNRTIRIVLSLAVALAVAAVPAQADRKVRASGNKKVNVNKNKNVNRNTNVNVNRDVNIDVVHHHHGGYYGGCCCGSLGCSYLLAPADAAPGNTTWPAPSGGPNLNAWSLNEGARFQVNTAVCCGRASSVFVVITSLRGSG